MTEQKKSLATFSGGCFWCMVHPFDQLPGILKVVSGYTGGHVENPTYEEVCTGKTGHTEAIQITYDPDQMSYQELLTIYWQQTDPTAVSYTHLTLPTKLEWCRSRWSPYH